VTVNETAILHATAAAFAGGGVLVSEMPVRIGLFALAAVAFVGGIVIARRDDESGATDA
jgi:hypothetical protein